METTWLEYGEDLTGWEIHNKGARLTTFKERRCLALREGGCLLLERDLGLSEYRLEADVAIEGAEGYIGLVFGARDASNYELVYLHPAGEGNPGWIQYDPVMNGSNTWQIYNGPRYQALADVPRAEWRRLSLDVYRDRVAIRVGDVHSPQLVVPLMHGGSAGRVGVWGYLPGFVGTPVIRPLAHAAPPDFPSPEPPGSRIREWLVSPPFSAGSETAPVEPSASWRKVSAEANGTLNLNRLFPVNPDMTVWAYAEVHAEGPTDALLSVGFSDRLRLSVNGDEVYAGEFRWNPPSTDGRIRPDFARIPVRLRSGRNTILARVASVEPPFGWGLNLGLDR